ncbi:MAG TPA: PAS domain-containing protein [Nitrospirota bacterium]|nr:PAS domain-containing protein [Nitrospirota bacterium]
MKKLSFLPIPALTVLIAFLHYTVPPTVFYDPGWLILITNTLFIGVICFSVAVIAFRNYLSSGSIQILLLGCGVLAFGIGGVIAGVVRGLPDGADHNVTIYNIAALVGALFHFIASIILISGTSPEIGVTRKRTWLAAGYLGVCFFMLLLTVAEFAGIIPPFFIQGRGPTPLRQAVLGSADTLFAFSFLVFFATYRRNKEEFLYWYSLALALTSISLTAFFIQYSVGSPEGWAGRLSQYLGGVYFLIALRTANRSADARKTSFDNILAASLSPAEEKFRALAENLPVIIDRFDRDMRHLYVNHAGLKVHGKPARAIIGKTIGETGLPDPYRSLWEKRIQDVFDTAQPLDVEDVFPAADGIGFYQSRCVPEFDQDGVVATVLVVSHDLTDRRRAEEELRASKERLAAFSQATFEGIVVSEHGIIADCNDQFAQIVGRPVEALRGRAVADLVAPDDRERVLANILENRDATVEHSVIRPDGARILVETHGRPLSPGGIRRHTAVRDITSRKQAEAERRHALEELDAIFNAVPYLLSLHGKDGTWLKANPAVTNLFGFDPVSTSREETAHRLRARFADGTPLTPQNMASTRALQGETVHGLEYIITDRKGHDCVLSINAIPLEKDGEVNGTVLAQTDITELRRADEALRMSEQRLIGVLESMPDAFVSFDSGLRYTYVNANAERLQASNREELLGRDVRIVYPDAESYKTISQFEKVLREQKPVTSTSYHAGFDRWVEIRAFPTPDGVSVFFKDVSIQLKAERALRESEEQYRLQFENLNAAALLIEPVFDGNGRLADLRYLMANAAVKKHLGKHRHEMVGKLYSEVFQQPERNPFFDTYERVLLTGEPFRGEAFLPALGRYYDLSAYRPAPDRLALILSDISERKQAEAEILKLSEDMAARNLELEAANKELESFTYSVSHDLRAPLRSLAGFSQIVIEDYADRLNAQGRDYLMRIQNSAEKMTALINDLLNLSRLSRQEMNLVDCDLSRLADNVVQGLRESAPGRNVEVVIGQGIHASADPNLMRVALTNLLDNAWKFTAKSEHAKIEFGVEAQRSSSETHTEHAPEIPIQENALPVYFVRDNGAGFDPQYARKMFSPFQRLHSEKEYEGTGIGLAIVERIVQKHGGTVWAEGAVGAGTTVYFTLGG